MFALLHKLALAQLLRLGLLLLQGAGLSGSLLPAVLQGPQLVGFTRHQAEAATVQRVRNMIGRTGMVLITVLPLGTNALEYRRC